MKKILILLIALISFNAKSQISTAQMISNINDTVYQNTGHKVTGAGLNGVLKTMTYFAASQGGGDTTSLSNRINLKSNTASPTFTTNITTPLVIGGTAVGGALTLKGTTGNGTAGVAAIVGNVGNNGATNAFNVYNDGQFLINTTTRNPGSFGLLRIAQGTALVDIGQSSSGNGAIYLGQSTPTASNWALASSGPTFTLLNAPTTSGTVGITAGSASAIVMGTFTGPSTSGARTTVLFNTGGSNNQTASTNIPGFRITPSTRQWSAGAIALQAENIIDQPTYSASAASVMSDGYNFYVSGAPIASTNLTITRGWAAGFNGNVAVGSNLYVGSTTTAPNSTVHIGGSLSAAYIAKTANYTLTSADYLVNCTANSFTITLPSAVGITGRIYIVKNTGLVTTITIATTSSQTIDGTTPVSITTSTPVRYMSDGANWITI